MSEQSGSALPGEDIYVVSDQHLGEGPSIVVTVKPSRIARWLRREGDEPVVMHVDNPLEAFHQDEAMEAFLKKIIRERKPGRMTTLVFNGDVLDPLAVRWKGGEIDVDPPLQRAAVWKLCVIMDGHRVYMNALSWFLRQPNTRMRIVPGNHDLFFVWPDVQRKFVERLTDDDPALEGKITFIDHTVGFEWLHRGVLYLHLNHAEPHNAVEPENAILHVHVFGGKPLKEPILNNPLGNMLAVRLANALKYKNPRAFRLREQRRIWWYMGRFDWWWVLYAARMLPYVIVANMFTKFRDIRHKAGLVMTFRAIISTAMPDPVDAYAYRRLKESGARAVVGGHSHKPCRVTGPDGTYVNTGTASTHSKLVDSPIVCTWKRFRRTEEMLRRLQSLNAKQKVIRSLRTFAIAVATAFFITTSFVVNRWHVLDYDLDDIKIPALILFAFWLIAFAYRTFVVRPEIVDDTEFPFGLVRHEPDDPEEKDLRVDLKVYDPVDDAFREKV